MFNITSVITIEHLSPLKILKNPVYMSSHSEVKELMQLAVAEYLRL
jgi:hypothetical protein